MNKRTGTDHLNDVWEFPGGKIELGELPVEAACREFSEEVGVPMTSEQLEIFNVYPFIYTERTVSLFTYLCLSNSINIECGKLEKISLQFNSEESLLSFPLPEANIKIIADLKKYIKRHKSEGTWETLWEM